VIGRADTRLVILRGNSGSGKSTVAQQLRRRLGRGVAWVEQDYLRRIVLREHARAGMPNIGLIEITARYALDAGYHVILEGGLYAEHYADMLGRLADDHGGATAFYYFDIPFEETARRHATRSLSAEVTLDQMRCWYQEQDMLGLPGEVTIGPDRGVDAIVQLIMDQVDFCQPPVLDQVLADEHLT
jgi:predicted kinase